MIHTEWMINLRQGPMVGSADTATVHGAWEAVQDAVRDGVPEYTPEHAQWLSRLGVQMQMEAANHLSTSGRWSYRASAIAITLTTLDT